MEICLDPVSTSTPTVRKKLVQISLSRPTSGTPPAPLGHSASWVQLTIEAESNKDFEDRVYILDE